MFPFLVALAMYVAYHPVRPALTVNEYLPKPVALSQAEQAPPPAAPLKKDPLRLGIATTARSVAVVDWKSGTSLFEKDADAAVPIASITKLMTALVVVSLRPDWRHEVEILGSDDRSGGIPYVAPGELVTVEDLFNLSLIASGNNATVALARSTGLAQDAFVSRMNAMAGSLGMRNSTFVDQTGLDSENKASARDVALLIRRALEVPEIRRAVRRPAYEFTARTGRPHAVRSTDQLLTSFLSRPPYTFLGGKTGFLDEAGYCLGAAAKNKDGNSVIAVVLGSATKDDRFREVKGLLHWAFDAYEWPREE